MPLFTLHLNIKAQVQPLLLGSGRLVQISIPEVGPPLGTKLVFFFFPFLLPIKFSVPESTFPASSFLM